MKPIAAAATGVQMKAGTLSGNLSMAIPLTHS